MNRKRNHRKEWQQVIYKAGEEFITVDAETEQEVSDILEFVHSNGYDLVAIEGMGQSG